VDGPVLVLDRLIAAFEVDDGKSARRQRNRPIDDAPFAVRPAMQKALAHHGERARVDRAPVERDESADPAHGRGV
jgi:hypothetical protein